MAAYDAQGGLVSTTGVQVPGVLDQLYARATDAQLGPSWRRTGPRISVWAPTAKDVDLLLDPIGPAPERRVPMTRASDGTWSTQGDGLVAGRRVRLRGRSCTRPPSTPSSPTSSPIPYSLALTTNSARSVLVDLDDQVADAQGLAAAAPSRISRSPRTRASTSCTSATSRSPTPPCRPRTGAPTWPSPTPTATACGTCATWRRTGMNTLHLLPANDIATIEEDRAQQQTPACDLASLRPGIDRAAGLRRRRWPARTASTGATTRCTSRPRRAPTRRDPDGPARTREFRRMVAGHQRRRAARRDGRRLQPHAGRPGQDPKSVLDRIVPGYYQRLNPTSGAVETSTCCQNTAAEHAMMQKLMVDSLVTWATEYKVDGFRFDLMGHHPKSTMLAVRAALDRADAAPRTASTGRRSTSTARAGTSVRSPTTRGSCRRAS